jgi:hypothetical protein
MTNFYIDIETNGRDPNNDQILSIQYQKLDMATGEARGDLKILTAWGENTERSILEEFIKTSGIMDTNDWAFVPVGFNLKFEDQFLSTRPLIYNLPAIRRLSMDKPILDLKHCAVIINRGNFKGCGLDKLTGKPMNGEIIPIWFKNGEYEKILDYIKTEAREFVEFNKLLYREMPLLVKRSENV